MLMQRNIKDILRSYLLATNYDPKWYKAWHTWALANFGIVSYTENTSDSRAIDMTASQLVLYVVQAIEGVVFAFCPKISLTLSKVSSSRSLCEMRMLFRTL